MNYENEEKNRKVQRYVFTIIMLSISILFGLLTIQNEAVNETNQTNSKNNTTQTSSNTTATTKSSNANLSNLGIRPHDFSGFKAATTSYKAVVPENTETIEVYAKVQDEKAKVTGIGKKTLQSGDNNVDVVVTAEDGTEKTYTINIVRGGQQGEYDENSGNGLLELKIGNLNLSPEFNINVYEYTAKYIGEDTKLEIEAKPTDEDYIVEVTGNENLQEGENTITILVYGKNENNVATYQITLNKSLVDEEAIAREKAEKKAKQQKTIIGIVIAVIILIAIVLVIIRKRRNQSIAEDYSGVSLYGKNDYDDKEGKEELPKALKRENAEEIGENKKLEKEKTTNGQEKESEYEEDEIENMPKEKIKEKFLDNYSNYEEEYEVENKGTKKKEKRKGKRFKE